MGAPHDSSGDSHSKSLWDADTRLPEVYDALRRLSQHKLSSEAPGQTLQATALVHEAWLRLSGGTSPQRWSSRAHFFAAAAETMRRILIDNARRKRALRHGGAWARVEGEEALAHVAAPRGDDEELLRVHDALDRLEALDSRKAQLVKLHYFAGLSLKECGEALGVSEPTAKRDWAFARAWLFRDLQNRT